MPVLRKRAPVDNKGVNGLYVHSNPPRILSVSAAHIKQLIRHGDIEKLEQVVLEGQGKKLVGEYSADFKTRSFLKYVPFLMSKISLLHDSVNSDRLAELQAILDEEPERKKKLIMAKDENGVGLIHKAVYYDLKTIYRWLIDKFPQTALMRDSEGRTPYFYTPMCKDPAAVQKLLVVAGADPHAVDYRQHTTKYYVSNLQELELPSGPKYLVASRKNTANKESLSFKKSNIRIWIHQRNTANLQQVVWEGHGPKLLVEHSNNSKMKKFLEAVPCIMGLIKDVHCDVQNDDLENLKNRVAPPVPNAVLTAKDSNGLTPLHKAVGLGRVEIVEYIVNEVPYSVNVVDNEERTPLHYAALLKDDNKMFTYLIEHGADESALDNRQKTAAYYKTRLSELDSKLLNVVPDCPRSAKEPASFDWNMLSAAPAALAANGVIKKAAHKIENGAGDKAEESLKTEENNEESEESKNHETNLENEADNDLEIKESNESANEQENELEDKPENNSDPLAENECEGAECDNENGGDDDSQEKSIEGDSSKVVEMNADEPEDDEAKMETQQEESNKDETQTGSTEEKQEDAADDENPNTVEIIENEAEPSADEPPGDDTNDENKEQSDDAQDDENNNEPDAKDPDDETSAKSDAKDPEESNETDENNEGSRTRPASRSIRTPSSRPASQASFDSRPGTAETKELSKEQDKNHSELEHEPDKADAGPEIDGEGVIEGNLHVVV